MKRKTKLTGAALATAIAFVGVWEGLELKAYRDIVGVLTICYGETKGVKPGDRKTKAECDAMLAKRLVWFEDRGVHRCIKRDLPVKMHVSFVSLSYNIGTGAFCKSTAARRANAGNYVGACQAAKWFNKAGGRKVRGLVRRREAEFKMCMEGAKSVGL